MKLLKHLKYEWENFESCQSHYSKGAARKGCVNKKTIFKLKEIHKCRLIPFVPAYKYRI